ncbi:MAG: heme ABC exporter ATP-binding protein CcmA [Gammaproteobacteria bacterium]|jgi:heme exporter protein A|nr:heme ABC exporter ATP-binding protein CcmA [Gammaproteobacteria bacterium]
MPAAYLNASNISYERHYQSVFGALTLTLQAQDMLVLSGANGSGKTTLLKILAGILRPTSGYIKLSACHYVGHQHAQQPQLTVLENLLYYLRLQGASLDRRAAEAMCLQALADFKVAELATRMAGNLSAGQLKRSALARLLLCARPIWLLDEPFVNLDKHSINLMLKLMRKHCAQGGITIIASHELGLADLPDSRHLRLPLRNQPSD